MAAINDFKQSIAVSDSLQTRVEHCIKVIRDAKRVAGTYKKTFDGEQGKESEQPEVLRKM